MKRKNLGTKLVAAGLTAALLLTGCGGNSSSGQATGSTGEGTTQSAGEEERPTITVAVSMNEKGEYSDANYAIKYIEDNTGVNIEFVQLPSEKADADTKLNLMLSSGEYPDVICYGMNKQKMVKFAKEGIFVPINDYIDKYGDNMKRLFEARPQYEQLSYAPDGNIYGFVTANECYHCQAYPKLWYNTEWLEALGLEEPQTTEELKEVLLAVKNSDYNGNGKADEIPLTGSKDWDCQLEWYLLNSFVPVDKDTLSHVEDGKVVFSCNTEEFKQGLAYLNELYTLGLIDPTCFTQTSDQMQQVIRSDKNLVFGYTADHFAMGIDLDDAHLNEVTAAMIPAEGPNGARWQLHKDYVDMTDGFSWFITDKCENPEIAAAWADQFYSEDGGILSVMGVEGKTWEWREDGKWDYIVGTEYGEDESTVRDNTTLQGSAYNPMAWPQTYYNDHYRDETSVSGSSEEDRISSLCAEPFPSLKLTEEESKRIVEINTDISDYVMEYLAEVTTGKKDLEGTWEAYLSQLDAMGGKEYADIYNGAYQRMK